MTLPASNTRKRLKHSSLALALEPRMMFDAAAVATATDVAVQVAATNTAPGVEAAPVKATVTITDSTDSFPAVDLFSGVTVAPASDNQTLESLVITVNSSGANQALVIDGTTIDLVTGVGATSTNSYAYTVDVSGDITTVTIALDSSENTPNAVASLIDGIAYKVQDSSVESGATTVTIKSLSDESDTTTLNISATITLDNQINRAPVIGDAGIPDLAQSVTLADLGTSKEVVYSSDGKYLYAANASGTIVKFAVDANGVLTREQIFKDSANLSSITDLTLSSDGKSMYAISGSNIITLDVASNGTLSYHNTVSGGGELQSVALSSDGKQLYVSTRVGGITVFTRDTETGKLSGTGLPTLQEGALGGGRTRTIVSAGDYVFVASGTSLVTLQRDADGKLTKLSAGTLSTGIPTSITPSLTASADGSLIYIGDGSTIRIYALQGSGAEKTLVSLGSTSLAGVSALSISSDGTKLYATSSSSGTLSVYSIVTNGALSLTSTLKDVSGASAVSLAPDGNSLVIAGTNLSRFSTTLSHINGSETRITDGLTLSDSNLDGLANSAGNYQGASITIERNGGAASDDQFSFASASGLTLENGKILKNGVEIATFTQSGGTLTITFTAAASSADANAVLQQITYSNTGNNADGTLVSLNIRASDGTLSSVAVTVALLLSDNSAPTLGATVPVQPVYDTKGTSATLFKDASVNTGEVGQNIIELKLTIDGLTSVANEFIIVDGTRINLSTSSSNTTTNGYSYVYTLANGVGTLTISSANGISTVAAQALVNGIAYVNDSSQAVSGTRNVTLVSLRDSGGTANDGEDTGTPLGLVANIVLAVNNAPVLQVEVDPDPTLFYSDGTLTGSSDYVTSVTLSANGETLYVTGSSGANISGTLYIRVYARDAASGELTLLQTFTQGASDDPNTTAIEVNGLNGLNTLTISPEGTSVYVAGFASTGSAALNSLLLFTRDTNTGALTYSKIVATQGEANGGLVTKGLDAVIGEIVLSADGKSLYTLNAMTANNGVTGKNEIAFFSRDPATGDLTFIGSYLGGSAALGVNQPTALVVSSDGTSVYVSNNANAMITILKRDTTTGVLTYVTAVNQTSIAADPDSGVQPSDNRFLQNLRDIVLSPDSKFLYVSSNALSTISIFQRDADGGLTYVGTVDAYSSKYTTSISLREMVLSADGSALYVTTFGGQSVLVFARDATTGKLTFSENVVVGKSVNHLAVSADGLNIYSGASQVGTGIAILSARANTEYSEQHPTTFADGLSFADQDFDALSDYKGSVLTIVRSGTASVSDLFAFADSNDLSLSGGKILYLGQAIADFVVDAGKLTVTFTVSVEKAVANQVLKQITYQNSDSTAPARVNLSVSIGDGGKTDSTVVVLLVNHAPVVSNDSYVPGNATVNIPYSVVLPEDLFSDADGDALTWQVDGLPTTLSFDPATRTISGTPDSKGSYTVTLTVTDTLGNTRELAVTLTVAADPALAPVLSGDTTDTKYAGQTDGWNSDVSADVLTGAQDTVLSSDGKYLYVVSIPESGTSYLSQYSRAADGSLTLVRSLFDASQTDGIAGLGGAIKVVLSADQQSLYVIGSNDNTVVVFSRDTSSGELTLAGALNGSEIAGGVAAIRDIVSVAGHVYIAAGDSLSVFSQHADGSLTLDKTYSDGADGMQGLASINRLQLSVDGQFLFVGGTGGSAIASALRIGADGALTYLNSVGTGENYIGGLAVSADGKTLYAINNGTPGSLEAISIGSDGRLTLIGSSALNLAGSDLVVSADGSAVFLVGEETLKVFTRAADGTLTHYADVSDDGVEFGVSFSNLTSISLSNDGKQLYISGTVGWTSTVFTMNVDLPRLGYTEGATAGALLPSAHLSSPTLDVTGNYQDASISIVRNGGALADDLFSFLDGNGLTLDGNQIIKGGVAIATFVQVNGELTVTFLAGSSQADAQNVLRQIAYANSSNDPELAGATPDFSVTFDDGAGNSTVLEVGVDLHGVNDPSVLISTPRNPDLAENGEGVKLFDGTQIDTIEADQTFWQVIITVNSSGPNEVLRVAGSNIVLQDSEGVKTASNGIEYSVTVTNGTTTVIIYAARDAASTATLIDSITYNNTASGLSGTRSIGLSIRENNYSGSAPVTELVDKVTVTLKPASAENTPPALAGPVPAQPYTEGDSAIAVAPGATLTDAQMDALNGGAGNYSGATLTLTLGSGATSLDTLGFNADNGLSLSGRTLLKDGVVIGHVTNTDGVLTIRFNDDAGTIPTTADVQNTLRQITYVSANHAPADSIAISATLSDRFLVSSTMALSIDITPVNDTPVIVKDPVIALGDLEVTRSISTLSGLSSVTAISLSQDGSTLYAADNRGVIALFSRNATTGELTYLSTLPGGSELTSINRLLISADGKALYAIGGDGNGLAVYSRDSANVLRLVQTLSSQSDFEFYAIKDIVQSPDGQSLYILGSSSLLVYSRDASTGQLTQTQTLGDGWNAPYLWIPSAIDVAGDLVFVTTDFGSKSLIAYRQGSDGQLTLLGFIQNSTQNQIDNPVDLGSLQHVAVSNDGRYVYIAGGDSVRLLSFDASNGSFTLIGVVASGLGDISDLMLSDDGAALFVSTANGTLNRYAVVDQTLILADTLQSSDSSTLGGAKQIVLDANGNAIVVGQGLTSLSVIATPAPIYIIGADPVKLAPGLSLSDAELDAANGGTGNYQGASVSISRAPSADSRDHFGFADGDGLSLVNGQIFKGGTAIATLIDLNGTLTLTFTAAVSSADANAIFSKLTYATDATGVSNSSVNLNMSFSDAALTSQTRVVQVTLRDPAANQSPIVGSTPYNLTPGTVGQNYSVTLPADLFNDPDGDTLTWQANTVPDGMSFDPITRILSGTPTSSGVLTLVVSDTAGLTATRTINFTVQVAGEPGTGNPTPGSDNVSPMIPVDPVVWHTDPPAPRGNAFDISARPGGAPSLSLGSEITGSRPLRFTDNIGLDSFSQPLDFTQPDTGLTVFDTPLRMTNEQSSLLTPQASLDSSTLSSNRERIGALLDMSGTSSRIDFQLPDGIFSSRDSQLTVSLRLGNGLPLPGWVSFDSRTGKIVVDRDRMQQAERLRLVLIARDANGKEIRIPVELQTDGNRTLSVTPEQTPAPQVRESRSQAAHMGVSEHLQTASQSGLIARAQALLTALLPKDATPEEKPGRDAA